MTELNKIYQGNALEILQTLSDESVDCVVTSPPYWGLRDYSLPSIIWDNHNDCKHSWGNSFCTKCNAWQGQLGLEPTFDLYLKHLLQIFDEIKRVLKKEGTCFINLGDTYNNQNTRLGSGEGEKNRTGLRYVKNQRRGGGQKTYPDKSLCQIPFRFSIGMSDGDWVLRNTIIWYKPNCMPSSVKDRFTVDFEYVFFFVKNKKYYFEQQFENHTRDWTGCGGNISGKGVHKINGTIKDIGVKNVTPNPLGRNKRCVWQIATQPFSEAHFAVFPPKLIEPMILAGCPEQGLVLDPFFGSGTTGLVALQLNRNFIGIEMNPEYIKIAEKRLEPYLLQEKLI